MARAPTWHGLDLARIERALTAAEAQTSAEIRVAVSRWFFWGSTRRAAERAFRRLHMTETRGRNAALIFLAMRRRRFELLGDIGIDQRLPAEAWQRVALTLRDGLRGADVTFGIERAIAALASELAGPFPPGLSNPNELPDSVATDV